MSEITEKSCARCKEIKPVDKFYKNAGRKSGYSIYCKPCQTEYMRQFGKWMDCERCSSAFRVTHYNIKRRKTRLCPPCLNKQLGDLRKSQAREFILSRHGYQYVRVAGRGYSFLHRKVMAESIGRPLERGEVVHHIDGDRQNNVISNLFLTTPAGHNYAHKSLERAALELVKLKIIIFNSETGLYEIALPKSA